MPSLENFAIISRAEYEIGLQQRALEQALQIHALYTARLRLEHPKHEAATNPVRVEKIGTHKLGGAAIGLVFLNNDLRPFYECEGRMADGLWSPDEPFQFTYPIKAIASSGYLLDYDDGVPPEFRLSTARPLELIGAGSQ